MPHVFSIEELKEIEEDLEWIQEQCLFNVKAYDNYLKDRTRYNRDIFNCNHYELFDQAIRCYYEDSRSPCFYYEYMSFGQYFSKFNIMYILYISTKADIDDINMALNYIPESNYREYVLDKLSKKVSNLQRYIEYIDKHGKYRTSTKIS